MADFSYSNSDPIETVRRRYGFAEPEDLLALTRILELGVGEEGGASLRLGDRGGIWFETVQGTPEGRGLERHLTLEGTDLEGHLRMTGPGSEKRMDLAAALILEVLRLRRLGSERRRQPRGPEGASFVPGVVHELRNHLFAMGAGLDAFALRFGEGDAEAGHAASLRKNLAHLQSFVEELGAYGNPSSLSFARVRVRPMLLQGLRLAGPLAASRGVALRLEPEWPEVEERMDRPAMEAAFRHLWETMAVETAEGGGVSMRAQVLETSGRPWLEVAFQGSPGRGRSLDASRLFEPFFYRDKVLPRLGLAIARRTIEAHGGQVAAAMESEDLRLRVRLPVWLPGQEEGSR